MSRSVRRRETSGQFFFEDGPRFRPEIQALRTIAVLSVVLFHLAPTRIPGGFVGVDVFFVISGFLITSHLFRDSARHGRPPLGRFWLRRIRRLLPAAFLVLAVTLVAVLVFVPTTLWRQFLGEIGSSAVYVENWNLAISAVDYFAEDQGSSPVEHYWSLSAEEQFYLLWPLLLTALIVSTRYLRSALQRTAVFSGIAVVALASLAYSAAVAEESYGYFSTFTHAWEFAAGGLLAILAAPIARALEHRPLLGTVLAWVGYALILLSIFTLSGSTPFPGVAALLPVSGVLAVIAAGTARGRGGPDWLASSRPAQWVGDISYSLYLWHWPPIILIPYITGHALNTIDKVAILVGAIVLAALTKRFVEDRFRGGDVSARRFRVTTIIALVTATAALVAACIVPILVLDKQTQDARATVAELIESECFGGRSMLDDDCEPDFTVLPALGPSFAKDDTPIAWAGQAYDDCPYVAEDVRRCLFGPDDAETTIAIVGDSHVRHYLPVIVEIAKSRGWQVQLIWTAGCRPTLPTYDSVVRTEQQQECINWKESIGPVVAADEDVDVVVTSAATRALVEIMPDQQEQIAKGLLGLWSEWTEAGKEVIEIPDNALAPESVPDCVAEARTNDDPCAAPRSEVLPPDAADLAIREGVPDGVEVLDLTGAQCDDTTCHFAVGGAITHYDRGHLTTTFVQSLRPYFEAELDRALAKR